MIIEHEFRKANTILIEIMYVKACVLTIYDLSISHSSPALGCKN